MSAAFNLSVFSGNSVFSSSNESQWYERVGYDDSKDLIRENITKAADSFIGIGYYLKHIKNKELFKEGAYENIYEFAEAEFGFSQSSCTRYMQMNDAYSVNGNSPILDDKYKDFNKSQLQEMLPFMSDVDKKEALIEQVDFNTPVKKIREIKKDIIEDSVDDDSDNDDLIDNEINTIDTNIKYMDMYSQYDQDWKEIYNVTKSINSIISSDSSINLQSNEFDSLLEYIDDLRSKVSNLKELSMLI